MTIEEILAGESKNTEFKVSRPEKSIKYMKSVVAFANGKGGRIVFGIDDNTRTVIGISEDIVFYEMDAITNAISDSCEPVIVPDVYLQTIEGRTVIVVEISAGKQKPYYIKADGITDGVYMRVSGTSRKADRAMTQEMYYESEGRSYDTVIRRDLKISTEEIEKLCANMKAVALANCKNDVQRHAIKDVTKNVLLNWGILAEDEDGNIHPTNAYVFLTGQDAFLSKIQCGMFKGTTRSIFVDKRDYDGSLWKQVEDAFQFVLRNIRLGAQIEGIYRRDIYELPPDSVRELIINAVMNCSFLQSSHIQVAIYDDRLEITSPGGLMPGVTIERMKEGYSQIRNHALAHAFSYMNLIEGWGTGIPRLIREMREYGLQEPEFIDMEIALRINLYRAEGVMAKNDEEALRNAGKVQDGAINLYRVSYSGVHQCSPKSSLKSSPKSSPIGINKTQKRIMSMILDNPKITQKEMAAELNITTRAVKKSIKEMEEKNFIERIGSARGGYWCLHE
ncbi:MAG: putative DNA binding domain-containing protein [Eubacterium sp.]|nr:putative DNA binding domain-containing protein [Eubacterium sp.]